MTRGEGWDEDIDGGLQTDFFMPEPLNDNTVNHMSSDLFPLHTSEAVLDLTKRAKYLEKVDIDVFQVRPFCSAVNGELLSESPLTSPRGPATIFPCNDPSFRIRRFV